MRGGFTCERHDRYVPPGQICPFHEDGDASAAAPPTVERDPDEALKVAFGESPLRRLVAFRRAAELLEPKPPVPIRDFGPATLYVDGRRFPVHVQSVTWHAKDYGAPTYEITGIVLDEAAELPLYLGMDLGREDVAESAARKVNSGSPAPEGIRWMDAGDGAGPYRVLGRTRTDIGWRERRRYQARFGDSLYDVIDPDHEISAEALPRSRFADPGVFDVTADVWLRRGVDYAFEGAAYLFATEIQAHTVSIAVRGEWVRMQPESGHYVWEPATRYRVGYRRRVQLERLNERREQAGLPPLDSLFVDDVQMPRPLPPPMPKPQWAVLAEPEPLVRAATWRIFALASIGFLAR